MKDWLDKLGKKNICICLAVLLASVFLFLSSTPDDGLLIDGYKVSREQFEDETEIRLDARVGDIYVEDISVNVDNLSFSDEECEELAVQCDEVLRNYFMEKEGGTGCEENIELPSSVDGFPFSVSWIADTPEIMNDEGQIETEKEGIAHFSAYLEYENRCESFEYELKVAPNAGTVKAVVSRKLEELLKSEVLAQSEEDAVSLPQSLDSRPIVYAPKEPKRNPGILLGGIGASICIIWAVFKDDRAREKQRREEILKEYPIVLRKMVMYMASGMTLRNTWIKICRQALEAGNDNPIYEEMRITENELGSGIYEGRAYERFGERIGDVRIVRFTALLAQNLKKGSTKLNDLLNAESQSAFEERIRQAKEEGAKVQTRLLAPMMLLLIVVMLIIMIPAFWSI